VKPASKKSSKAPAAKTSPVRLVRGSRRRLVESGRYVALLPLRVSGNDKRGKGTVRVEVGQALPPTATASQIEQALEMGVIEPEMVEQHVVEEPRAKAAPKRGKR